MSRSDTTLRSSSIQYDLKSAATALCLSIDKKTLYCGLFDGTIRAYPWPFMSSDPPYVEVHAHSASVVEIREVPSGSSIVSIGDDGTIFTVSTLKGDMMSFGGIEMSMYTGTSLRFTSVYCILLHFCVNSQLM